MRSMSAVGFAPGTATVRFPCDGPFRQRRRRIAPQGICPPIRSYRHERRQKICGRLRLKHGYQADAAEPHNPTAFGGHRCKRSGRLLHHTTRGFTRDAEAYSATAPLKLVDGSKLVASIKRGLEGSTAPDSYKALCRQCGEIITHKLAHADAMPCSSGHPVAPTIARAALVIRKQEGGSTSRTYTQPRQYTRREVNAHNGRYIAKMKRRKPAAKNEPPAAQPEIGPDPFAGD